MILAERISRPWTPPLPHFVQTCAQDVLRAANGSAMCEVSNCRTSSFLCGSLEAGFAEGGEVAEFAGAGDEHHAGLEGEVFPGDSGFEEAHLDADDFAGARAEVGQAAGGAGRVAAVLVLDRV